MIVLTVFFLHDYCDDDHDDVLNLTKKDILDILYVFNLNTEEDISSHPSGHRWSRISPLILHS